MTYSPALFRPGLLVALLMVLFMALASCAPMEPVMRPPTAEEGPLAWETFVNRSLAARDQSGPIRVSATLRYEDPSGESTRVSALLWGNGPSRGLYPLRLDLQASMGITVAKIREDASSFLAYSPDEKTAYTHAGKDRSLLSFGVPIPVSLGDLSLLLAGQAGTLLLPPGASAGHAPGVGSLTGRGIAFAVPDAPLPGIIELSPAGTLLSWRDYSNKSWVMEFAMNPHNPLEPSKVVVNHPSGHSATITVKSVERLATPFNSEQLALNLPDGTARKPLGQ